MSTVASKTWLRKGTAAEWSASNPILDLAEPGYVTDTKVYKIGDGVTAFDALPSYPNATALNAAVATANAAAASAATATATAATATTTATAANATANAAMAAVTGASVGAIVMFPCNAAPAGYLKLNGATLNRADFPALWTFIQSSGLLAAQGTKQFWQFGDGNGSTTFSLLDSRGLNLMTWDDGRGLDTGRGLMSYQDQQLLEHNHGITQSAHSHWISDPGHAHGSWIHDPGHSHRIFDQSGPTGSHGNGTRYGAVTIFNNITGIKDADWSYTGIQIGVHDNFTGINSTQPQNATITISSAGGAVNRIRSLAALACIKF